jgi:hypothetical protein
MLLLSNFEIRCHDLRLRDRSRRDLKFKILVTEFENSKICERVIPSTFRHRIALDRRDERRATTMMV